MKERISLLTVVLVYSATGFILTGNLQATIYILNTYWTRPSPTSSLLRPDKVILGKAKLSPILFCTGAINWMLNEVKSNKCFIIPKN